MSLRDPRAGRRRTFAVAFAVSYAMILAIRLLPYSNSVTCLPQGLTLRGLAPGLTGACTADGATVRVGDGPDRIALRAASEEQIYRAIGYEDSRIPLEKLDTGYGGARFPSFEWDIFATPHLQEERCVGVMWLVPFLLAGTSEEACEKAPEVMNSLTTLDWLWHVESAFYALFPASFAWAWRLTSGRRTRSAARKGVDGNA